MNVTMLVYQSTKDAIQLFSSVVLICEWKKMELEKLLCNLQVLPPHDFEENNVNNEPREYH